MSALSFEGIRVRVTGPVPDVAFQGWVMQHDDVRLVLDLLIDPNLEPGTPVMVELQSPLLTLKVASSFLAKVGDYYSFSFPDSIEMNQPDRSARRRAIFEEVSIDGVGDGCKVFDVSLSGFGFESPRDLSMVDEVTAKFPHGDEFVTMRAEVVYCRKMDGVSGHRVGCQIIDMPPTDAITWRDLILHGRNEARFGEAAA